jgi:L,D-peptidoglycan transpeptidase YkuD (ErfK/YbiS/YcfS/YnhG family)
MIITVHGKRGAPIGRLTAGDIDVPCALGRSGIVPGADKKEGDGATPAGRWPLRQLLYRPDRLPPPQSKLPVAEISPSDGWCDDPEDTRYNLPTPLPYAASAESLWREDELYNLCVILGHNDAPVIPYKGSAIFFHVAKQKGSLLCATEGCVALPQDILLRILTNCSANSIMEILLDEAD